MTALIARRFSVRSTSILCAATLSCAAHGQLGDVQEVEPFPALPQPADLISQESLLLHDPDPGSLALFGCQLQLIANNAEGQARLMVGRSKRILEFTRNADGGWDNTQTIEAPEACTNPGTFGTNFVCDETIVVVRPYELGENAQAYVYERNAEGFSLLQTIGAKVFPAGSRFGFRVAVKDGRICFFDREGVQVFKRGDDGKYAYETWIQPINPADRQRFGRFVSIDGDRIAVSLFRRKGKPEAVDICELNDAGEWVQVARIEPIDGMPGAWFGERTIFDGNELVVSSPRWEENAGRWDLFERNDSGAWLHSVGFDVRPDSLSSLATAIARDGDVVVAGASMKQVPGSAYVFVRDGKAFKRVAMLGRPDGQRYDGFGAQVAVVGNEIIVSSPSEKFREFGRAGVIRTFVIPESTAEKNPDAELQPQRPISNER